MAFAKNCRKVIELDFHGKGWLFRSVPLLRILSQVEKPNAILCGVDEPSLGLALLVSRIRGGRVFAVIEDPPFTTRYERIEGMRSGVEKRLRTRLLRSLLDRCAGVFCFIEKEILKEIGTRRVPLHQMMNGASAAALDWVKKNGSSRNSEGTFTVGLVGALTPAQGIGSLLEILSMAKEQNGQIRLRLIGPVEPGYTETLRRRIKELNLDRYTEVTGWLPYPLMLGKLQGCSAGVYCNPSTTWYRAAQPLKVCEYLAARKPTVAWDYPGMRRLLDHGRLGILVPEGNKSAFLEALIHLSDPAKRHPIEQEIDQATQREWTSDYWYGQVLKILKGRGLTCEWR